MKRILAVLMAMVSLASLADTWTDPDTGISWSYSVSGGKATIERGSSPMTGAVAIPSEINGYAVTSIGEAAFWCCEGLTSVTIPSSVTSIGGCAFEGSGLTSLTIPEGVTNHKSRGL